MVQVTLCRLHTGKQRGTVRTERGEYKRRHPSGLGLKTTGCLEEFPQDGIRVRDHQLDGNHSLIYCPEILDLPVFPITLFYWENGTVARQAVGYP